MVIRKLLEIGIESLTDKEYNNPMLEAKLLLAYVLNTEKDELFFRLNEEVATREVEEYYRLIVKRKEGYPIQYILGNQEFMGLEFKVKEGVLIPRSDTEILVENIIKIAEEKYRGKLIRILDLCTGSGAIGISLAKYIPNSLVDISDISDIALRIAEENSKHNETFDRINIIKSDLFENIKREYDIIVSNPPYIETDSIDGLQLEISKYEPRLALDGGKNGLDFYKKIVKESIKFLKEDGALGFEIGFNQGKAVEYLMKPFFYNIEIFNDLGGKQRTIIGFKI